MSLCAKVEVGKVITGEERLGKPSCAAGAATLAFLGGKLQKE